MPDSYYFVNYSRHDSPIVQRVVAELQARDIPIWLDTMLIPGENWATAIYDAVRRAEGLILFVSQASMDSEWVRRELSTVTDSTQSFIIPVILEDVAGLPKELLKVQWIDGRGKQGEALVDYLVEGLTRIIAQHAAPGLRAAAPALTEVDAAVIAEASVAKARGTDVARGAESEPPQEAAAPDSVFIVHGHDLALLDEVEQYIDSLGVKPIVLTKISNTQQSLLQKFLTWSRDVRFAVVLISADDRGASRRQFDPPQGVGDQALQFRARQNVILELGFFYGYLGWEHVFVLHKRPDVVFPNFEVPSDLGGVPFDQVDADGQWKTILAERLRKAGFNIP